MNRGEAVAAIQRRLGFYTKKADDIVAELGISQGQLEAGIKIPTANKPDGIFKPWFLTSEVQTAVTVVDEDRVPFPAAVASQHSGFIGEVEDAALWILDPDAEEEDPWLELRKFEFDELLQKYPGSGMPKGYAVTGVYFRLRHIPDDVYSLKIITFNADLVPTADGGTNKWLTYAPTVLWAHAGIAMATSLRDSVALNQFKSEYTEAVLSLYSTTEERLHTNRKYVMGGDD